MLIKSSKILKIRKEHSMEKLRNGLKVLSVSGKVSLRRVSPSIVQVNVNDEYFGLWDVAKATFVD